MIFKIFSSKKFGENVGVFDPKYCVIMQKVDHNIGVKEKRQFFRRKLAKNIVHLPLEKSNFI
jgi:hypothetical protein